MNYRFRFLFVLFCGLVAIVGCGGESVEEVNPTGPDAPEPPTAQEIAQKIVVDANLDMPVPVGGGRFPASVRNSMLSILKTAKTQHSVDPVGKEALEHVVGRIEKRVSDSSKAKAWQYVMVFIEAHELFKPGSRKYGSLKDEAYTQLKKPRVSVTGLPEIEGRQLILLSFYIPMTDKRYKEKVQIGDEIHGVKVISVFGQDRGVTLEYMETGERFVAFLPGAK